MNGEFIDLQERFGQAGSGWEYPRYAAGARDNVPEVLSNRDHPKVAVARMEGFQQGVGKAEARIRNIMGAPGIAGDGKRMSMALDLAAKAPGMNADAVTDYVLGIASEAETSTPMTAEAYEESRACASAGLVHYGLAQSAARASRFRGGQVDPASIYAARKAQTTTSGVSEDGPAPAESQSRAGLPDPARVYTSRRAQTAVQDDPQIDGRNSGAR